MSSGAKQGLKISPETVAGTTPTPYARQDLRHTSCTIDGQIVELSPKKFAIS